ncbi:LrgB family protein Ecym_8097 [Eremothecium cymbalariae DBVPG|uniref:LrgB-like protein n=1 Tax=Eremothecium cymbalariae (strain CBS 270.75 / DBVPG 7215 / KCTC 17166 / NRRL Y-17582) TaxID=931890 RepID=G8JX17_ERECY|nr:Hypothetical protein Ecym_8097 [Eremothecium cymbalariae DBVPG\
MFKQWHYQTGKRFFRIYHKELIREYILIPLGVVCVICVLYGVDRLIKDVFRIKFPASVAVMLVNFAFMCMCSMLKKPYADMYISIIDVPLGWSLRWMNLFFTPAFVTLPLSDRISFKETMLIVATFVIGYVVGFVVLAYITILCQKTFSSEKMKSIFTRQHELGDDTDQRSRFAPVELKQSSDSSNSTFEGAAAGSEHPSTRQIDDHGLEDIQLMSVASNSNIPISRSVTHVPLRDSQISKNEKNSSSSTDPVTSSPMLYISSTDRNQDTASSNISFRSGGSKTMTMKPPTPTRTRNSGFIPRVSDEEKNIYCERAVTRQIPQQMNLIFTTAMLKEHFHHIIYSLGFFASMFSYFFSWYTMPYHFFTAVCTFMFITNAPLVNNPKHKRFVHPVICSVALTWLIMLVSVLIKHRQVKYFITELRDYKTTRTYLNLFNYTEFKYRQWPGAGDVFSSCMDVSIVALSMPMFSYRRDLRKHFLSMIPPICVLSISCLTLYPLICHKIGISTDRSIGFVGRNITLALGTPTIANLNGSITLMAVTTVLSGVLGALTGGPMLDWIKVPEGDYVTRGVTLGCNSSAIATAYLLGVDKRAAAISSLSFVLFGTFMVILSSIDSMQSFVYNLAAL